MAFRGFEHVIKGWVHIIQSPVKGTAFEMATPHQQCQSFGGAPCMIVETLRTRKSVDVFAGGFQIVNGALNLPDGGVHWDSHEVIFLS